MQDLTPGSVQGAGVALMYAEEGEGPATVLVHGMGGADAEPAALPGRVITYDRRGYGHSEAPTPYTRTTVNEQAEDLACVVRHLDAAPALLAGRDFGALVVLDVLLRHAHLARAAVLVDPPAYALVPEATAALSEERAELEARARKDGLEAAVQWWRRGRPPAAGGTRPFFADFAGLATLPLSRGALGRISVPVTIVTTPGAPPHIVASARALARPIGVPMRQDADWRVAVREASGA